MGILLPLELLISGASAAGHLLVRPFLILSSLLRRLPKRRMREDADAGPAAQWRPLSLSLGGNRLGFGLGPPPNGGLRLSPLEAAPLALALRLWLLSCDLSEATPRKRSLVCGLMAAAPQLGLLGGEPLARPLCGGPSLAMPQSLGLGPRPSASGPWPQALGLRPLASAPQRRFLSIGPLASGPWLPALGFWP